MKTPFFSKRYSSTFFLCLIMSFPFLKRPSKHSPVNISSVPSPQSNYDDNSGDNEVSHDDDVEMSALPGMAEIYLPNVGGSGAVGKQEQKNPNSAVENPMVRPTVSGKNKPSFDLKPSLSPSLSGRASNYYDELIFDSITPNFSAPIFWAQLFSHIFVFLAPILLDNPRAQRFYGWSGNKWNAFLAFFSNSGLPLLVYLCVFSFLACNNNNSQVLSGALYVPIIYFIQHKLIVAVKYASLTKTEYRRIMNCKDDKLIDVYQNQLQLISGWLYRDDLIIDFEINAACVRIGTKINNVYFVIPDPKNSESNSSQFRHWIALLRGMKVIDLNVKPSKELQNVEVIKRKSGRYPNATRGPTTSGGGDKEILGKDHGTTVNGIRHRASSASSIASEAVASLQHSEGRESDMMSMNRTSMASSLMPAVNSNNDTSYYRLSVYDLCLTLIRRCDARASEGNAYVFYATYLYNFINFMIPLMLLIAYHTEVDGSDPWLYVFLFSSTVINILFGLIVYNLLYVSIFGKNCLSSLIFPTFCFCSYFFHFGPSLVFFLLLRYFTTIIDFS
jgi:hypothetical protein